MIDRTDIIELRNQMEKLSEDNENLILDIDEAENLNMTFEWYFKQNDMIENFIPLSDDENIMEVLEVNFHELVGKNWFEIGESDNMINKKEILEDLINIERYDAIIEKQDLHKNDDDEVGELYDLLNEIITKYNLDYQLNDNEYFLVDRIYGNGSIPQVAYYYIKDILESKLINE